MISSGGVKNHMDNKFWKILNQIEKQVEQLPYKHLKIEINLKDGSDLVYEKDKQNPIGFIVEKESR